MTKTNKMTEYRLTCHVDGCENCDVPIVLTAPTENVSFMCGPCCNEIMDVVPLQDAPPPS
ncbi:hypothetical protein UFOVP221_111 [uncultured Caudovirales phage]|uniref:Uncharacterized protein n=1 Tax=uncultured Caudovirales phage TaxID=2100421 RepID=A0A6J7WX47_9CAUD|nr:hypothetical protein UFOVP221_111 [uncultured Caudovirales phage]